MNASLTNSTLHEVDQLHLDLSSYILIFMQVLNFCLGLPLNVYVIVLLVRAGGLDGSLLFSLSQTVTEILFVLPMPLYVLCLTGIRSLCFNIPIMFFIFFCLNARIHFQWFVCFERYLAVVHPVSFLKCKLMKCRVAISVFMWASSLIAGILTTNYFFDLPFTFFGVMLLIVLSMHLYFCFSILRVLRRPRPGERMDAGTCVIKKKALEVVTFSLLAFLIQIFPVAVTFGMKDMLSSVTFMLALSISINITIAAGILQPIMCLHQIGKLRFIYWA